MYRIEFLWSCMKKSTRLTTWSISITTVKISFIKRLWNQSLLAWNLISDKNLTAHINGWFQDSYVTDHTFHYCSFHLYITQQNHKIKAKFSNLPRNVCFPASPSFWEVLKNGSGCILFDSFRHHVHNIMHHLKSSRISILHHTTTL